MEEGSQNRRNFAGFYRSMVAPLRRHLARILRDDSEAEDIAHDAFIRVRKNIENDTAEKPEALLYTTARRLAFNRLKRRRVAPFEPGAAGKVDTAASREPGVVQQVIARQEWRNLEQAIAQLPEGCRTVLLLCKVEMLSHKEISERLGIAISTIEKQHARALRLLRAALASTADSPVANATPTHATKADQ